MRASSAAAAHHSIVDQQNNDRSNDGDDHAVDIQPGNARCSEQIKYKSPDESADYSERDVEPEALALTINNLASNKTGNQAKNSPAMIPMRDLLESRRPRPQVRHSRRQFQRAGNLLECGLFFIAYWRATGAKKAALLGRLGNMLANLAQPALEGRSIIWRFCINELSGLS